MNTDKPVNGKTYTSNLTKLLKHLDKMQDLQNGIPISPVMIHLAITGRCNLRCSYCCYGGRNKGEELTWEQISSCIEQFTSLGTKGIEITGSGEPLLHPFVNQTAILIKERGASVGLITNGTLVNNFHHWDLLDWARISFHIYNHGGTLDKQIEHVKSRMKGNVGGVYIWTKGSETVFRKIVDTVDRYEMPTRITPDLTQGVDWIRTEMPRVAELVKGFGSRFAFVSDFNIKIDRLHDLCFMHLIKPYIHSDGNIYVCPGASFSPENFCNVDRKYFLCSIEDITKTYSDPKNILAKHFDCAFCKYQMQNEFIADVLTQVDNTDFA